MFIRRTKTRTVGTQDHYFTFRLVKSVRIGNKVRQRTLLNLGAHFDLLPAQWPLLCQRLDDLLGGQATLMDYPEAVENHAQRIVAQLISRQAETSLDADDTSSSGELHRVDVDSLQLVRPRTVGVEHVALWAMQQVGLPALLAQLGLNSRQQAAAVASIIGRLAAPGSERATHRWLRDTSALGDLLQVDFENYSLMQLYRASDALMAHREAIEAHLFGAAMTLFDLQPTVTLYDLTNTYFEGDAGSQEKAKRGHSKEKRSDCPLLTLGLMLDASGFVRRSQVFAGNVSEPHTLAEMLTALQAPKGALVVMDRGIATQDNITYKTAQAVACSWLAEQGYRYLVVSRERKRTFDLASAMTVTTATQQTVHLHKVLSEDGQEARLYCYSEAREQKEKAIAERFAKRFEKALTTLSEGLSRPRTQKRIDKIWQRIGRLKEKSRGVAQHYDIDVTSSEDGTQARAINWRRQLEDCASCRSLSVNGSMLTHPGVYCLRSNQTDWDEETLWRTYITLTDLEAVFRSLKSELGLRPIYHHKALRTEGHLFITKLATAGAVFYVIAYQLVQVIRRRLRQHGQSESWTLLRRILNGQQRITATFRRADQCALHVRKATVAEPAQREIYQALGISGTPGGIQKTIIEPRKKIPETG